ncbi:hypothetical protein [Hymenobacter sp. BT491]|uniref:hypothetical protein n=1 Tax=Hymenobacter sp. BT491 TaxID=2766779 RepID=UPI001CA3A6F5|nr:hypothetical protein [Hymenobacter sp. BT491]
MLLKLLFTSAVLEAHYDEDTAWLYLDWRGRQDLAQVQAVGLRILAVIEQTGARKVLNDNTHITHTSWELVEWVSKEYLPQVGRAGIEYVAWVQSPLLASRSNIDRMARSVEQKPLVAIFGDVASAYTWLSSVTVPVG